MESSGFSGNESPKPRSIDKEDYSTNIAREKCLHNTARPLLGRFEFVCVFSFLSAFAVQSADAPKPSLSATFKFRQSRRFNYLALDPFFFP